MSEMRQAQRHYSVEEYLSLEAGSNVRHEYLDGEILAMSGGSRNHNQIAQNLTRAFDELRSVGCRAYVTDLRLNTPAGLYTYPNVMLICGEAMLTHDNPETVTNPLLIAEVLSDSTRDYDRMHKFDLYREIPSLRDYLLIDQYSINVEHRFLTGTRWESKAYTKREDAVQLTGVGLTLHVDPLYDLVHFSSPRHDH
jgi:Uma2 family endonuclease